MTIKSSGFEEIEHTADWALRVWGADLSDVFQQAALGMYALMETRMAEGGHVHRSLDLDAADPESLLVAFLSELLYLAEMEGTAFDHLIFHFREGGVTVELEGANVAGLGRMIKAVTFHGLEIVPGAVGLEARVVFDV